jgi:hypothetical protein
VRRPASDISVMHRIHPRGPLSCFRQTATTTHVDTSPTNRLPLLQSGTARGTGAWVLFAVSRLREPRRS